MGDDLPDLPLLNAAGVALAPADAAPEVSGRGVGLPTARRTRRGSGSSGNDPACPQGLAASYLGVSMSSFGLTEVYCLARKSCASVVLKLHSQRLSRILFVSVTLFVVVVVGVLVLRGRGAQSVPSGAPADAGRLPDQEVQLQEG